MSSDTTYSGSGEDPGPLELPPDAWTPAMMAAFLWVLIHIVRELGLSLMLYTLQSQVLSTKIWLLWENGRVADACATGVLTVAGLLLLLSAPTIFRGARGIWRAAFGT